MEYDVSVIVPARNEQACIDSTISAIHASAISYSRSEPNRSVEILVVDNLSSDGTVALVERFIEDSPENNNLNVRLISSPRLSTSCARNDGVANSAGKILVFVDADTVVPPNTLNQVAGHVANGKTAGISRYKSLESGFRAWCWWTFWNYVRELPIPRAKAMPAFMFCTREVFDELGPFDESVKIGEEWPILASVYRNRRPEFVYDRRLVVGSSSRRMAGRPFGYLRTFSKWVWAVLHVSGRRDYHEVR